MSLLEMAILRTLKDAGVTAPPVELEKVLAFLNLDDVFLDYGDPGNRQTVLFFDRKKEKWRIRVSPHLPLKRLPFDLAHECVEFIALREGLEEPHFKINEAAAELLIPTQWARKCLEENGMDLFALRRTFSTASFDTCALKMVRISAQSCFLVIATRQGNQLINGKGRGRKTLSESEVTLLEKAFNSSSPFEVKEGKKTLRAFPVPDDRKREIQKVYLFIWD
jgi:hypothetical protein